jgi:hypothetical protein
MAIDSRNILLKFLGWQSLMRNYLVMYVTLNYKTCQVEKFDRIFSNFRYFKGRHARLSCDRIWIKQKGTRSNFYF